MLKKIGIIVLVVILLAAVGFGLLLFRLKGMANSIEGQVNALGDINLSKISDGTYTGSCGEFLVSTTVAVEVKHHQITKITVKKQLCGQGYEALETIDRIIKAQSPKVDAVTGASTSSRSIMVAVHRALNNK